MLFNITATVIILLDRLHVFFIYMYALIHPLHVSSRMIASFMHVRCVQVCLHQEYIALVNQQQHLVNTLKNRQM